MSWHLNCEMERGGVAVCKRGGLGEGVVDELRVLGWVEVGYMGDEAWRLYGVGV